MGLSKKGAFGINLNLQHRKEAKHSPRSLRGKVAWGFRLVVAISKSTSKPAAATFSPCLRHPASDKPWTMQEARSA